MAVDDDQGQAEPLSILSDGPAAGRRNGAIVEATIIWTAPLAFAKRRPLPNGLFGSRDGRIAQLVEQLTLNQRVQGSSPCAPTIETPVKIERIILAMGAVKTIPTVADPERSRQAGEGVARTVRPRRH